MNLVLLQPGQSAHPKPDPVRRTAAPVTMIAQIASRAPMVTARYCAAESFIPDQITAVTTGVRVGQTYS